jgi:peptidoglycan/xylan/chitin deacetylase (PgdA/CDA1 family)
MRHTTTFLILAAALLLFQNASARNIKAGIKPLDRAPAKRNGKRLVCMTFDDGPSSRTTPAVLEVLRQHRIPGCFFVIGEKADSARGRELLRSMVNAGHTVANHTQTHPASQRGRNCATLSPAQFEHEVRTAGGIILRATDVQPKFFRFPGGFATQGTVQHLKRLGYTKAGWHTDPWDWWKYWSRSLESRKANRPPWMPEDKIGNFVDYAVWAAKVNKGGLFLLHDIKDLTANNLDALITKLKANNFTFVPITDRQAFPVMNSWLDQQN